MVSICQIGVAVFSDGSFVESWSSLVDAPALPPVRLIKIVGRSLFLGLHDRLGDVVRIPVDLVVFRSLSLAEDVDGQPQS